MSVSSPATICRSNSKHNQKTRTVLGQVKRLFGRIDASVALFRRRTSLSCQNGCGHCCLTPKVETTVLEMLPLAEHLMENRQADLWHDRAREADFAGPCVVYDPHPDDPNKGRCRFYDLRPGICRLYGFSGVTDKRGGTSLLTCKVIRQSNAALVRTVQGRINRGMKIPLMKTLGAELYQMDPVVGNQRWPINKAIALAIEKLSLQQKYRGYSDKTNRGTKGGDRDGDITEERREEGSQRQQTAGAGGGQAV